MLWVALTAELSGKMMLAARACDASSIPGVSSPCRMYQVPRQRMSALLRCRTSSGMEPIPIMLMVERTRTLRASTKADSHWL